MMCGANAIPQIELLSNPNLRIIARMQKLSAAANRRDDRLMVHGDLVSSRQLRAAWVLAGLTRTKLSVEAGYSPKACRYWESHGDRYPAQTQSTLDAIVAVLARHSVTVFRDPTPGARLCRSAERRPSDLR
jgi:hypothetical protein